MFFTDHAFIGIDLAPSGKSFTYAVLDRDLNLLALADAEMDEMIKFVAGQKSAVVAVNAPAGVNRGLVREKLKRELPAPQKRIRGAEFRLAEYELRARGISVLGTPARATLSALWMQLGFDLYRRLQKLGYVRYPNKEASFQVLETNSHACYSVMVDQNPLPKSSLEGRLQRQVVLYERGVKIKDPMDFFEEITRYKIIKGNWPVELVYLPEQLDAMVAAYTAWLAVTRAEKTLSVGDAIEGLIVLPEKELRENYPL